MTLGFVTDLLVADLVHELKALQRLLDADTNVLLCQGAGPEAVVEVEQPLVWLHTQESCHILVVGKSGRQTHQADHLLRGLWTVTKDMVWPAVHTCI